MHTYISTFFILDQLGFCIDLHAYAHKTPPSANTVPNCESFNTEKEEGSSFIVQRQGELYQEYLSITFISVLKTDNSTLAFRNLSYVH